MAAAETLGLSVVLGLCLVACGGAGDAPADAGADVQYGHKSLDAQTAPEAEAAAKVEWDRMGSHSGIVLAAPHLRIIYIGQYGADGSQSFDAYLTWLIGSTDYWSILAQYGVGYGTFDGSNEIDTDVFFTPGMVNGGIIDSLVLQARIKDVINNPPPLDAGLDDSGDAGDAGGVLPAIPIASAYIFFLPDNVNVDLGSGSVTCQGIGGYHSFDGTEPYAIIPPCGRHGMIVSHETAEMVTDPLPGLGWFSDADVQNAGGEVGDLCNFLVSVDGNQATGLWSNKDGDCEPQ